MRQLPTEARRAIAAGYSPSFIRWSLEETERELLQQDAERLRVQPEQLAEQLAASFADRAARAVDGTEPPRILRDLAKRRAALMLERIAELPEAVTFDWLQSQVQALDARGLPELECGPVSAADQLQAMVKRATCPAWWRRQLRRTATRRREAAAHEAGAVGIHRRTLYVTNDTAAAYVQQQAANREALERTELEAADGQRVTLAVAHDASTANKAIRRGELMTRLRGCEDWAQARGLVGDFATLTTPSRFHPARTRRGSVPAGRNPNWDGSSPSEAQGWLCRTWAKVRAKLHREGVRIFGFRIAEPHHDGTPHWHALWWSDAASIERVRAVIAAYWLADDGDEPGADRYRVKFERIDPAKGSAVSYLAKYVAKNIDDFGQVGEEGHRDEALGEQLELDGAERSGARRVAAWAAGHSIRQFQAIGQPPVGVWRELRRLPEGITGEDSPAMRAALIAANRTPMRRACWAGFMSAMGGAHPPVVGHRLIERRKALVLEEVRAWSLKLAKRAEVREGVYGPTLTVKPFGVEIGAKPGMVYRSERREWKPRGAWSDDARSLAIHGAWGVVAKGLDLGRFGVGPRADSARPQAARPWTRVNNCTQHPDARRPLGALPGKNSGRQPQAGPPDDLQRGPGGHIHQPEPPPWTSIRPTPPPAPPAPSSWSPAARAALSSAWALSTPTS